MHRLYTEINWYSVERQQQLLGKERRESMTFSDGAALDVRQWLHQASEWLVDQLVYVGNNLPCLDNDLACDMQFVQ